VSVPPADRRTFPAERRAAISPSHAAFVALQDWPAVAAGLAAVLNDQAPAYVAVKLPDAPPPRDQVRRWLTAAGITVTDEADADRYWHLLLARTTDR
jgi:DNA-binding FadR family transcriptional regulator